MRFFTKAARVGRKIGLVATVAALCAIALTVAQAPAASNLICSGSNVVAGVLATCPSPPPLLHPTMVHTVASANGASTATAMCPPGQVATGGGTDTYGGPQGLSESTSVPFANDPARPPTGWIGYASPVDHSQFTVIDVYAICVPGS